MPSRSGSTTRRKRLRPHRLHDGKDRIDLRQIIAEACKRDMASETGP
jgi:hypothetical protein